MGTAGYLEVNADDDPGAAEFRSWVEFATTTGGVTLTASDLAFV
ncbi:hypothetical protein [Roseomonas alba]|nr:hypothetical protein [Neoroseomonas alba]